MKKFNSLEALADIEDELKYVCADGIQLTGYDQRRIDKIRKNLLILEIFKNHLYFCSNEELDKKVISQVHFEINIFKDLHEKDFNVIKEWIYNEIKEC